MNYSNIESQNIIPRGISNGQFGDFSYANSVLQCLSCLDSLKEVINKKEYMILLQQPQYSLANQVFNLILILNKIYNKDAYSDPIIISFINKYNNNKSMIQSQKVLDRDPFQFFYFLLQFLHLELNIPKNPNYNLQNLFSQPLQCQKNDEYMLNLFLDFFDNTQNSIISDYFFSIEKYTFNCFLCGIYYSYSMRNLFKINIEKAKEKRDLEYPNKKDLNLNVDDILNYYFSTFPKKCKNCGHKLKENIKILLNTKVLIIFLDRRNHTYNFNGDIDFTETLDLKDYVIKSGNETKYILKACICFNGNKYLSYCKINFTDDKNNEVFYRFIDNQVKKVRGINELYEYEPQMLFYELQIENDRNNDSGQYYSNSQESTIVNSNFDQNSRVYNYNNYENNNYNNQYNGFLNGSNINMNNNNNINNNNCNNNNFNNNNCNNNNFNINNWNNNNFNNNNCNNNNYNNNNCYNNNCNNNNCYNNNCNNNNCYNNNFNNNFNNINSNNNNSNNFNNINSNNNSFNNNLNNNCNNNNYNFNNNSLNNNTNNNNCNPDFSQFNNPQDNTNNLSEIRPDFTISSTDFISNLDCKILSYFDTMSKDQDFYDDC